MNAILFRKGRDYADLMLSGVRLFPDGSIRSGHVNNGNWFFERLDGEVLARRREGGEIVTRQPDFDHELFFVPEESLAKRHDLMWRKAWP